MGRNTVGPMPTVSVRCIYRDRLGFEEQMHPVPTAWLGG
jgi:hypothetical protein